MEEAELIEAMKHHDQAAFELIYERYYPQAYRTACFITGSFSTGEDVVQDAFVECFIHIQKLKDVTSFRAWFYKILTRLAWKASNKAKKSVPVEDVFENVEQAFLPDTADTILRQEEQTVLWQAVSCLPQKQKTVVVLYYYNNLSISEIAKALSCLEGTVKSRLYFARQKLYQLLYPTKNTNRKVCGDRHEST